MSKRIYTIVRHGREIEVEEVTSDNDALVRRNRKSKNELFAYLYLLPAAKAFNVMNCPKAMVWVWLVHKARTFSSNTFTIPNGALMQYGVSRKVKYLALRQLEEAGLITVDWRSRKTPMVTLL
jgi:hypothetical protein